MSIVIVGGNECMTRRYVELCREYNCKAKVYPKMSREIRNIGRPDLMILFTSTMSHKLVNTVLDQASDSTVIARSHTSSMQALKRILEEHVEGRA